MALSATTSSSQLFSSFLRFDSEFFRPAHVEISRRISSISHLTTLGMISQRITQGSNPSFSETGLACVNGKNVYFGTMTEGDPNFVSPSEFERLSGYRLRRNDLVVTLKHATRVGRAWIVEDDEPRIFSRNIGLIRLRGDSPIRPSVLLLYLWTGQGQFLLDRCATGGTTGQITLPMSELRRLPVPLFKEEEQDELELIFNRSRDGQRRSKVAFSRATNLLEDALAISPLLFERSTEYATRFSTANISESLDANRIDAQSFSPEAVFYQSFLTQRAQCDRLGKLLASVAKGRQQCETENGSTDYCSIKHISEREIVGAAKASPGKGTPTAKSDDLLLAITGATIGKIGIVKRYEELAFSGDMLRLRANDDINPYYLLLVLNHHLGQVQFNRWITGSTNGHLSPRDIRRVLVPRLTPEMESEIAALVEQSIVARHESEMLLEQAKARVEQLIEEAVAA